MLFETPELDTLEGEVLKQLDESYSGLRYQLQQRPRKWQGQLARTLRARAVQGSNTIEGHVVSEDDALAAVLGAEPAEGTDETAWINVVNYRDAMQYVLTLSDAPDFAYSKDLLRSLHFIMMRHDASSHPGVWRQGPIFVKRAATGEVVYEGPPAEEVPALIQELVDRLTDQDAERSTRFVRAAMAHLNLVMIHPFTDGNGRMSRCLQTLVVARAGLLDPTFSSIEEYLGRNVLSYYEVLAEVGGGCWNPSGSARPWVRFCLKAHYEQARRTHEYLDRVARIGQAVEAELEAKGLPERAATSLTNVALGAKLRNDVYRHEAEVSMVVASRDLKALADAGLPLAIGDKRGRHYVAADRLKGLSGSISRNAPIPDPFAQRAPRRPRPPNQAEAKARRRRS
jgi:Fic family protein